MRIRSIKPEFWSDEKLARARRALRLTFVGLWSCSDDHGVTRGNPAWIRSQLYPYDENTTTSEIQAELDELEGLGFITGYHSSGEKFYYIHNFSKHQRIDRRSSPLYPQPTEEDLSMRARRVLDEGSRGLTVGTGSREQGAGNREGVQGEAPPARKRAAQATSLTKEFELNEPRHKVAIDNGLTSDQAVVEFAKFCDHFLANGKRMKDWDAAWRNWTRRAKEFAGNGRGRAGALDRLTQTAEVFARRQHERQSSGGDRQNAPDTIGVFPLSADRG
jgi:hypothetical protein